VNLDSSLSERPKRGTNEAATCRHTANSERGATEESGLRENRTSRLIERTVEGPIGPTTFDSTLRNETANIRSRIVASSSGAGGSKRPVGGGSPRTQS
jgi:hypothetical protein